MVKYYLIYADVYVNGERLYKHKYDGWTLCDEKDAVPYMNIINWDNLHNQTSGDTRIAGIKIYNLKKGTRVEFWGDFEEVHRPLKEWKGDKLDVTVNRFFEEKEASLQKILEYPNAEIAIQYLKERGLSVCPLIK